MNAPHALLAAVDFDQIIHDYVIPWGSNLLLAILVFVVGRALALWLVKCTAAVMEKREVDAMLIKFVSSILKWALLLVVAIAALDRLGVPTTSMVAVLGAAGLAVGLAVKDSLQNFAAGVMLIIFRPFKVGDFVEVGGTAGIVEEVQIFSSQLRTPDNQSLIVPNGAIMNDTIKNVTARDERRLDLVIGIGYDDDLKKAKEVIEKVVRADERVLEEPEPLIVVGELGASSVDLLVRPWTKTADHFATKCDLTENIKLALDEAGISIPFPQMEIHQAA